jgi:hypothetical protein
LEVFRFANKQIEKHYPNGFKVIYFPDKTIKIIKPDGIELTVIIYCELGEEDIKFQDGTLQIITANKHKIIEFEDGHIEKYLNDGRKQIHKRYNKGYVSPK